jgi:N-acetylmuramoyl-L-alanine amidase
MDCGKGNNDSGLIDCYVMPTRSLISQTLALSLCVIYLAFGPQAAHSAQDEGLTLLVVWPPDKATVDGERVRVGGRTDPNAQVTVNGKPMRVFPSGAFAGTCPLKVGVNEILFRATKNDRVVTDSRTVTRPTPLQTLPATPIQFDPNYDGQPSEDLVVRTGDTILIRVKGSPGHKATFRIGSGETHYPLFPRSRYGAAGFYEGAYPVKSTDRFVEARVTCYLAPGQGKRAPAVQMRVPGKVTVNANPFPDVARAKEDYVRLRAEPRRGAPLLAVRQGTYLAIDGRFGNLLRVALTPSLHAWVARDFVEMRDDEPPLQQGAVEDLSVAEHNDATVVRIPLGLRVPFAIKENPHSSSLEITLFGVENNLNWITDRTPQGLIEAIAAVPSSDGSCKLDVSLRAGGLLGYRAYYDGADLCISLRHPLTPPADAARPLAGRTILLDPGHGGASKGTVGSSGLEEKIIDLEMSRVLRRLLEGRGARVRATRAEDVDVSLADRARQAEQDGDLLVSIHNNSIALTGDPLAARGMGVYYYHSHSRDVAQAIYRRMLNVEPRPEPYGVVMADLYIPREITAMPSVLLECLFLSNPEDEMLLLDKAYVERDMEAVAEGIADWFAAAARKPRNGGE